MSVIEASPQSGRLMDGLEVPRVCAGVVMFGGQTVPGVVVQLTMSSNAWFQRLKQLKRNIECHVK